MTNSTSLKTSFNLKYSNANSKANKFLSSTSSGQLTSIHKFTQPDLSLKKGTLKLILI